MQMCGREGGREGGRQGRRVGEMDCGTETHKTHTHTHTSFLVFAKVMAEITQKYGMQNSEQYRVSNASIR